MKRSNIAVRIQTITQAGSKVPGRAGNLIINKKGDAKPENWFSSREFRNALLSEKLNPDLPLILFRGITITGERLEIEPADIEKGGGKCDVEFPGIDPLTGKKRIVTYKQAGIHNINLQLDLASVSPDVLMVMADLSMKHAPKRTTVGAAQSTTSTETIVDETVPPPENQPVHEDIAGG